MGLSTTAIGGQETKAGRDRDVGGATHVVIEVLKNRGGFGTDSVPTCPGRGTGDLKCVGGTTVAGCPQ